MAYTRKQITDGRKVVDTYRLAHTQLYVGGWHKGISEAHTPLLNIMLKALDGLGFNSLDEFFSASEELDTAEGVMENKRWQ